MTAFLKKNCVHSHNNIIITNEIKEWHLHGLLDRSIDAIRIPQYYTASVSQILADKIRHSNYYGSYINAPLIGRVGQAYFECQNDPLSLVRYQKNALIWMKEMRKLLHPHRTPIDRLKIELDETWEGGCTLATLGGRKMFAGLVREFKAGSYAEPHCDVLEWDIATNDKTNVVNQLAANVYLQTPFSGGELVLWDEWPTRREYNAIKIDGSYGVDRDKLSPPKISINPLAGDLIIFNPMRVHSVEKIKTGSRVTWTCFIGSTSSKAVDPLVIWS